LLFILARKLFFPYASDIEFTIKKTTKYYLHNRIHFSSLRIAINRKREERKEGGI